VAYDDIYTYLLKRNVVQADTLYASGSGNYTGSSIAVFTAVTASAPDSIGSVIVSANDENNFIFFVNGAYIEHDALTIQQSGSSFYLYINRTAVGYDLDSDDEVFGWGRFQ